MALPTATSRLKPFAQGEGLLKYQIPSVFKEFVVGCVRDLSINDRAALRFLCLGNVPGSQLDVDLESDLFTLYFISALRSMWRHQMGFTYAPLVEQKQASC